jgi:hypothetical protein
LKLYFKFGNCVCDFLGWGILTSTGKICYLK